MKKVLLSTLFCFFFCFVIYGQKAIKVLAIGNSFSEDAVEAYLFPLGEADDVNFIIGNVYVGGCSLEQHWKFVTTNAEKYSFRKIVNGEKTTLANQTMEACITNEDWDYITFQQASPNSGQLDTFFPYLKDLKNYVMTKATNLNVQYAMHQTWAYDKNSEHEGFANYDRDQMRMYNAIVSTVKSAAESVGIDIIIPAGTAVQNVRGCESATNLTRDGYHLSNLGRYIAACTWFEKLTGKSAVGNGYYPEDLSVEDRPTAQNAAHLAIETPFSITQMKCSLVELEE